MTFQLVPSLIHPTSWLIELEQTINIYFSVGYSNVLISIYSSRILVEQLQISTMKQRRLYPGIFNHTLQPADTTMTLGECLLG